MRVTEFDQLVADVFGEQHGAWLIHSHVITELGDTSENLIESGVNPKKVWAGLCDDFDIPEEDRFGEDRPSL